MHLPQHKLCTRKMEPALQVKFFSRFSPKWREIHISVVSFWPFCVFEYIKLSGMWWVLYIRMLIYLLFYSSVIGSKKATVPHAGILPFFFRNMLPCTWPPIARVYNHDEWNIKVGGFRWLSGLHFRSLMYFIDRAIARLVSMLDA